MAVTLNANTSTGFIATSDTSGVLQLQTGGTTALTVDASQRTAFVAGTAALPAITTTGDTNTGIFFPAADTIAFAEGGTEAMRLDSAGNMGLGVTPSAWGASKAIQISPRASLFSYASTTTDVGNNLYYNGTDYKYLETAFASFYRQSGGVHSWLNAASGTAGNTVSLTQAMTLDASGNLGLGTTSPQAYTGFTVLTVDNATNGGIVSIRKNGTVYGNISPTSNNMTIDAVQASAAIVFRTGSGSDERARIESSGNLLVGNTSASSTSGSGLKFLNDFDGAGDDRIAIVCASSTTAAPLTLYSTGAGAYRFYVGAAGTVFATNTTITAISDQRLKENIRDLDDGLQKVMALQPRKFDWKEGKGKDIKGDRGWIAQEFEQVFPDMIGTWLDEPPEGEDPYKSVRADLIPTLVKAIQEQQAIIQTLTDRITALEGTTP
jgi:hypothetical protein